MDRKTTNLKQQIFIGLEKLFCVKEEMTEQPHQWKWTPPSNQRTESGDSNIESDILSIYYVYVLEETPPVYRLYIQLKDGRLEPVASQQEKNFKFDSDRRAVMMAKARRQEIPVAVSKPQTRERGPSCSIC